MTSAKNLSLKSKNTSWTQVTARSETEKHRFQTARSPLFWSLNTALIFTNFKHFYLARICLYYKDCFRSSVSYNRFVELQQRVAVPMMLFLKTRCLVAHVALTLSVQRILRYTITGVSITIRYLIRWRSGDNIHLVGFYGFKLHLIINDKGEMLSFTLQKAMLTTGT